MTATACPWIGPRPVTTASSTPDRSPGLVNSSTYPGRGRPGRAACPSEAKVPSSRTSSIRSRAASRRGHAPGSSSSQARTAAPCCVQRWAAPVSRAGHLGPGRSKKRSGGPGSVSRPERGVLDVDREALAGDLVPRVDLVEGAHLARGDRRPRRAGPARLGRPGRERRLDDLDRPARGRHPLGVGGQAGGRRVDVEAGAEPAPQALAADRDLHAAVGAVEQPVRRDRGVVVALRPADLARRRSTGCPGRRARRRSRRAARCGPRCPAPVRSRSSSAARTPYAPYMPASRSEIGTPDLLRVVGAGAGQRHQPGLALRDLVVAGAAALGAVVPEAGDREHHQPRVQLLQRLEAEPEPLQHAGAEVLHQHVGAADQGEQQRPGRPRP